MIKQMEYMTTEMEQSDNMIEDIGKNESVSYKVDDVIKPPSDLENFPSCIKDFFQVYVTGYNFEKNYHSVCYLKLFCLK